MASCTPEQAAPKTRPHRKSPWKAVEEEQEVDRRRRRSGPCAATRVTPT